MLSLRKETDYALQLLKFLSFHPGSLISLQTAAETMGVSFLFLQKIARKLRIAGLIKATQGTQGGYRLSLPANKINLEQIIKVMEGNCSILPCLCSESKNECCRKVNCGVKKSKKIINFNKQVNNLMKKIKLSDL